MFKHPENEEDLFFSCITTSSKLASIFETTVVPDTSDSSSNKDLTYYAPKQPQTSVTPPSKEKMPEKKLESIVSLVKIVYGYKYVNNAYESLGKVGFALVEYPENKEHNIILYKTKNDHLFNIRINKKIIFTIQENKYLTLLDEQKKNWSLLFQNKLDLMEFYNKLESTDAKIVKTNDTEKVKEQIQPSLKAVNLEEPITEDQEDVEEIDNFKTKSNLLTRMAKVGQLVGLPQQLESGEMTDSEENEDQSLMQKVSRRTKKFDNVTELPSRNIFSPAHSKCLIIHKNQQIHENLGTLLSESRNQNTEVRLNLLKLENKIDKLYDRVKNESDMDLNSEIMKLQLQNEQLKLELQKMQFNRMVTESNSSLNAGQEKTEKGASGKNPELEDIVRNVSHQLDDISQTGTEIHSLRDKYESLAKEIETLEIQNRKQEIKINSLETFFCEVQPLRRLVNEVDEANIIQNISECNDENSEVRHKLKQLTDSMQEYMTTIDVQDRKIKKLENYFRTITNPASSMVEVDSIDVANRVQTKLNDFDRYFQQTQEMRGKLEEALKTIRFFENKIVTQETKLTEFISTLSAEKREKSSAASSDVDISICSACLQLQATELASGKKSDVSHSISEKVDDDEQGKSNAIGEFSVNVKSYKADDLDDIIKQKIDETVAPLIKDEMNTLYGELQEILKEDCQLEATSMIVQATYKIINNIQSHCSL